MIVSVYGKIDRLSEIAGLFPDLRIHLEHTGMPAVNGDRILALARFPNVSVKFTVSGLKGISREAYPHRDAHPFLEKVFRSFGEKRIMCGSNYPPVMKEEGYEKTLRFLTKEMPWLSPEEREWTMGRTALERWRFQGVSVD